MERIRSWGVAGVGLMLSAVGFAGIVKVEGQAVTHREWGKSAKVAVVVEEAAPLVAQVAEIAPVAEPAPAIRVPGFVGLRPARALARATERGLSVRFVDVAGNEIPEDARTFYRVARQKTRRGTEVEASTVIELVVRERASSYSDWG